MTLTPHGPVLVAPDEAEKTFCPEDLAELAERARKLRTDCLLTDDESGADVEAEQFFLLAMSSLEQAERFFRLAGLKQSQSLAGRLR